MIFSYFYLHTLKKRDMNLKYVLAVTEIKIRLHIKFGPILAIGKYRYVLLMSRATSPQRPFLTDIVNKL